MSLTSSPFTNNGLSSKLSTLSAQARTTLKTELQRRITETERGRFIDTLYPDSGPLRRELYVKHLEFWRAGARHDERAFVAGNRCLTLATVVETDQGERQLAEIADGRDFGVVSWVDGLRQSARALPVFPVGIEPAFRLLMDNGEVVECSGRHRVLTAEGWLSLAQLVRRVSGQRCWSAEPDCWASCGTDNHLGDLGLPPVQGNGLDLPPLQGDVQRLGHPFYNGGGEGRRSAHSRVCPRCGLPSTLGAHQSPEGRCGRSAQPRQPGACAGSAVEAWSGGRRAARLSLSERHPHQEAVGPPPDRVYSRGPCGAERPCRDGEGRYQRLDQTSRADQLSDASSGPRRGVLEWLHDAAGTAIFYPSGHSRLIGGQRIVSITGIGYQQIVDFTVPGPRNYRAAGVIHHNTGKTTCVAYEDTLHLTGDYSPWWEGRRFDRPVVCWACGTDAKAVREKLQPSLIGPAEARGTGMIPRDRLLRTLARSGTADAVDFALVRHVSGGVSRLVFKAYEQGRASFQSAEVDVVHLDEEPPMAIYTEALTRTLATVPGQRNGVLMFSFTPLEGLTDVVLQFLPGGAYPGTEELRKQAWGW